jgi:hypothetical protein
MPERSNSNPKHVKATATSHAAHPRASPADRPGRFRLSAVASAELKPKVPATDELAWDARPTPLHQRFIDDPAGSGCQVLVVHLDDRGKIFTAAGKRVPPSGWRGRRPTLIRLVVEFEFKNARGTDVRTLVADTEIEAGDLAAWDVVRTIYEEKPKTDCVRVSSRSHGDTLLIFPEALVRHRVVERDAALYAIGGDGVGERDPIKTRPLLSLSKEALVAVAAAIIAHPATEFVLHHAGVTVHVPAFVPAAVVAVVVLILITRKRR